MTDISTFGGKRAREQTVRPGGPPSNRRLALPAIFLSLLLVACGGGNSPLSPDSTGNSPPEQTPVTPPEQTPVTLPEQFETWGEWAAAASSGKRFTFAHFPAPESAMRGFLVYPNSDSECCLRVQNAPTSGSANYTGTAVGVVDDEGGVHHDRTARAAVTVMVDWASNWQDVDMTVAFDTFQVFVTPGGDAVGMLNGHTFNNLDVTRVQSDIPELQPVINTLVFREGAASSGQFVLVQAYRNGAPAVEGEFRIKLGTANDPDVHSGINGSFGATLDE